MPPPIEENEYHDFETAMSCSSTYDGSLNLNDDDISLSDDSVPLEGMELLIEIVGAINLRKLDGDLSWNNDDMRPHCTVNCDSDLVHETKKSEMSGRDPIWTLETKSVFVLSVPVEKLTFQKNHNLSILVMTEDQNGFAQIPSMILRSKNPIFLGLVQLDCATILSKYCNEKRVEFPLMNEVNQEEGFRGTLSLRFRIATKSDIRFLRNLDKRERFSDSGKGRNQGFLFLEGNKDRSIYNTESDLQSTALNIEQDNIDCGSSVFDTLASAFRKNTRTTVYRNIVIEKVRIKPNPDPKRIDASTFMSALDIKYETRQPSHFWLEAGSGTMGKVYLEVLSCHDLHNTEVGRGLGDLPDAFVTAICEDGMMQTSAIDNEASPHWMPWTRRAFCFNIEYSASMLYLAVFDFNLGIVMHEPIGRVAVNLNHFKTGMAYMLKYNLYDAANVKERIKRGTIKIRLRVEINDMNAALMNALRPRPKCYLNVKGQKSFRVVRYTCFGKYDSEGVFDSTIMLSYLNEALEYKRKISYKISDAITSLIFWRGQVRVSSFMLPLHSLFFFCACAIVVEYPYMLPSFFLLSLPWILLATNRNNRQKPYPWDRPPSVWTYLWAIIVNKSPNFQECINAYEGWEEKQALEERDEKRLEDDLKIVETNTKKMQRLQELGDDQISSEVAKNVIPVKVLAKLSRIQLSVRGANTTEQYFKICGPFCYTDYSFFKMNV
mmetsp:Transcript_39593/g.92603  ORF Transcript_39593/g.92603 Transcript_39593/m.92603 type:complete len:719 (-) Transcript_39593:1287-3443(-)